MQNQPRRAFTLFQLLIVVAILLLLLALLLPAVQKVREAAARATSQNNLHQILLAAHDYHSQHNSFPPGVDDKHFSATSRLLPYLPQDRALEKIDFTKSIDDPANAAARNMRFKVLDNPRDTIETINSAWGPTNYLYNDQVFFLNSKVRVTDLLDGTSNTIGVAETLRGDGQTKATDVRRQYVLLKKNDLPKVGSNTGVPYFKDNKNIAGDRCASWMDGRFLQGTFNGRLQPNDERPDVSCGGVSGVSSIRSFDDYVMAGLCDGSVRTIRDKLSQKTWKGLLTPSGGEVNDLDQ